MPVIAIRPMTWKNIHGLPLIDTYRQFQHSKIWLDSARLVYKVPILDRDKAVGIAFEYSCNGTGSYSRPHCSALTGGLSDVYSNWMTSEVCCSTCLMITQKLLS